MGADPCGILGTVATIAGDHGQLHLPAAGNCDQAHHMAHYPRPSQLTVSAEREPVAGSCPRCGRDELSRYPVLSEGGWFQVVKCQACLHSVERTPWRNLGPIELLSDQI